MSLNQTNLAMLEFYRELKDFWRGFFIHISDHLIPHSRNNYNPHMLNKKTLGLFSGLLIAVKVFSFVAVSLGPIQSAQAEAINSQNIITLTNEARNQFKLNSLQESQILNKAAQAKAEDMAEKKYFAHTSPEGKTPWNFIENVGYKYIIAGENLAINFTDADTLEQAWMNSPKHKANILKSEFEEIGIGVAEGKYGGKQVTYVVQMFGTPSDQKITLLNSSTKVEKNSVPDPLNETPELNSSSNNETQPQIIPVSGNRVLVKVQTEKNTLKVLANFGNQYAMLYPKLNNNWEVFIDVEKLTSNNAPLKILVYTEKGLNQSLNLASFSKQLLSEGRVLGTNTQVVNTKTNSLLNNITQADENYYLWFAVVMLSCLIMAIAIHPKIQHVGMIANGSLVVILAILLWSTG